MDNPDTTPRARDPLGSGASHTPDARLHDGHRRVRSRLAALPALALLVLFVAVAAGEFWALRGEYVMFKSSLDTIVPDQAAGHRFAIGVAIVLAYAAVWHFVGFRLVRAHDIALDQRTSGGSGAVKGAFGALGLVAALIGTGAIAMLAWVRGRTMADQAATRARAVTQAPDGSPLPQAQIDARAQHAYAAALWEDIWWVVLTMVLLAALAVVASFLIHALSAPAALAVVDTQLWLARRLRDRANTQRSTWREKVRNLQETALLRAEVDDKARVALSSRFDHARAHTRVYLASRIGVPEYTDHIVVAAEPNLSLTDPSSADLNGVK